MLYILCTLISWLIGWGVAIFFRLQELDKQVILIHKQLFSQITVFILFALVFREFFTHVLIDLGFMQMWWFMIYLLCSSLSFYAVQVFFEFFSGNKMFATEQEMKDYLEKVQK